MNIVMISTEYFPPRIMNANHNRMYYLAKGLNKNHEVYIICPNKCNEYKKTIYKGIKILMFPINRTITGKLNMILKFHKILHDVLKKENIKMDILWYNSNLTFMASGDFTCLKIYDVMGIRSNEILSEKKIYNYIKYFFYIIAEKILYNSSDIIITINNMHKKLLSKKFKKKIYLIRDAFEPELGINNKLYHYLKEKYKNNFKVFFVGSLGRERFIKNIDALESLSRNHSNIKFIIAGEGIYRSRYEKQFRNKNINSEFVGFVSDKNLNSYIKVSDICFSDVYLEGFPYKIFEYMAMSKISLVEQSEGVKEVLIDDKNALLYSNSKEFESKILKIINNKKLKKQIEKNALVESQKHSWDVREKEFEKIINDNIK